MSATLLQVQAGGRPLVGLLLPSVASADQILTRAGATIVTRAGANVTPRA